MNNTKWTEIFRAFYYEIELDSENYQHILPIFWTTKSVNGYVYRDSTWSHFGVSMDASKEIDWLKIELTDINRQVVLDVLRKVHVPGEVFEDCVYVYGYRTDVGFIE